ncbi:hypothetical protein Aduo_001422 [Ancylostoma duodenale]
MGDNMSTYLKYIALPEVRVYSGRDRDYTWENFIEAFSLKYPTHSWSGAELKALLKSKLSDKAKAQYDALPTAVKQGSFEGVVAALANSNKIEARTSRIIALGKLRQLRKTDAQSVAEYCVELERWSSRAYPELDERALATARAQQLYEQLVDWPESYHLLEAMERDGPNTYENLKEVAMRVERRRLTMDNVRDPLVTIARRREPAARVQPGKELGWTKDRVTKVADSRRDNRRNSGEQTGRSEPLALPKDSQVRCYKCNGRGHMARDCRKPKLDQGGAMGLQSVSATTSRNDDVRKPQSDENTDGGRASPLVGELHHSGVNVVQK